MVDLSKTTFDELTEELRKVKIVCKQLKEKTLSSLVEYSHSKAPAIDEADRAFKNLRLELSVAKEYKKALKIVLKNMVRLERVS